MADGFYENYKLSASLEEHAAVHDARKRLLSRQFAPDYNMRYLFILSLALLPANLVREFWRRHLPVSPKAGSFDLAETERTWLEMLWRGKHGLSMELQEEILADLTVFLPGTAPTAHKKYMALCDPALFGIFMNFHESVSMLSKQLYRFLQDDDLYRAVCDYSNSQAGKIIFGSGLANIGYSKADAASRYIDTCFTPDIRFVETLWYDCAYHTGPILRSTPTFFGLPRPFGLEIVADCRPPGEILTDTTWRLSAGDFWIESVRYGHVERFEDVSKRNGWDLSMWPVPDIPVVAADRDYYCPRRRRTVMKKGFVYGAPLYVARLSYSPLSPRDVESARGKILECAGKGLENPEHFAIFKTAQAGYHKLMKELNPPLRFSFDAKSQILFCNRKRLVSGQAARILRRILEEHGRKGQKEFEYIQFKYDSFICSNPKASNFETYFSRLEKRLQESLPEVSLRRTERGRFRMECNAGISLETR